jgi:cellulose synthase operon protein C
MKIVRSARLWFKEGASDKVYEVDLTSTEAADASACFLVNFRFGRRGQTLKEGTKTPAPVSREAADKIFDSVVVSKLNEGYRRTDGGEAPAGAAAPSMPSHEGRERELIARLEACLRDPWPPKDRDRLFWRVGETRLPAAGPLLAGIAERLGHAAASYSLVWALARCAGAAGADALAAIGAASQEPLVRSLASFALASPLLGERQQPPQQKEKLPESLAQAIADGGVDAFCGAFSQFAQEEPLRVGPVLVELYALALISPSLHAQLAGFVRRTPVRPPYVPGLRRLFKYAEMLDDGPMFAAAALRFESEAPMYRWSWGRAENERWAMVQSGGRVRHERLSHLEGAADATTAYSQATLTYFKRRIWRALRKRGELGSDSFLSMATAYLLALNGQRLPEPQVSEYYRWENGHSVRYAQYYTSLARIWAAGHLLYAHSPDVRFQDGKQTWSTRENKNAIEPAPAFPELWDANPEYALHLAALSRVEPVAMLGVSILKDKSAILRLLAGEHLAALLASPFTAVQELAFNEALARIADGQVSESLIAALLSADLPAARELAIKRIELAPPWPWHSAVLGFELMTSLYADVREAAYRWCGERRLSREQSAYFASEAASWLAAQPATLDEDAFGRVRHLRICMRLMWPSLNMPLTQDAVTPLLHHPAAEVAATGVDMLVLSGVNPAELPDNIWAELLGSPAPEVQAAALGLLNQLDDEALSTRIFLVLSFATASAAEVREAARPLIARLTSRFPKMADDLCQRLIATLFQTAPDEDYVNNTVALLYEAMTPQIEALDAGTVWRLLQAKAKGAQILGASILEQRAAADFSVRQIARLGNHPQASVRQWAMDAYSAAPERMLAEAQDAILLIESDWEGVDKFAQEYFERWPEEAWTPEVMGVAADSNKPRVQAFARSVLRRLLKPGDASLQLTRLLEHPATSMHLLITEVLTSEAAQNSEVFRKLLPLARIVFMQVNKGRAAKDRLGAFLHAEALKDRERAERIAPLFASLSLSAIERDRTRAVLALSDIGRAFPDLPGLPLQQIAVAERTA